MPHLVRTPAGAQRSGSPVSVVLPDLDHFKRVNDEHGHAHAQSLLKLLELAARRLYLAQQLRNCVVASDAVGET
jgi:GGDEF domain-containing protein